MKIAPLTSLQLRRPLIVFDLETTHLDLRQARIVEIAWIRYASCAPPTFDALLLNHTISIPRSATDVHGIADGDVVNCPTFADVAPALHDAFRNTDLAGFGIKRFDLPLLCREFERAGHLLDVESRAVIDAAEIFHLLEPRT